MSDLLVELMPNEGHFEYMRQRAAALKKPPPEPPPIQSPGGNPPDLTQFSETFEPSGGLFAPGYPTGEDADETGIVVPARTPTGTAMFWPISPVAIRKRERHNNVLADSDFCRRPAVP